MKRAVGMLCRPLLGLALLALFVLLLRRMDLGQVARTLRGAALAPLGLALVLNLTVNTFARVRRWSALLAPLPHQRRAGFFELAGLLYASYATSNLLPARAGEALRTVGLYRRGYAVPGLVAVQLCEKVIEALSICLLAGAACLATDPPRALARPLHLAGAVGAGGVLALVMLSSRGGGTRSAEAIPPRTFLRRLMAAAGLLRAPHVWSRSLFWSCASDATDLCMIGLALHAVGAPLGFAEWAAVLLAINLALTPPSTPAYLGTFEAAAVLTLGALGVRQSQALAFALLYHSLHVLPTTLLGLLALHRR